MLYPKKCPMCHQILKQKNSLICSGCAGKIRPNVEPLCKKCGRPVKTEEEYCQDCRREQHYFSEGRSIFSYGEMWRQSLVRFKYYGCREYGDFYAKAMSIYGKNYLERWRPQLIVPVPLHPRKNDRVDITRQRIWQNGSVVSAGYPGGRMWYEKYEIQDRKRNSMPQNGGKILKMHIR